MPIVSVNMAVYNCEPYLRQALDSVLAQSFSDWECIMVDDASTDGSADIAKAYVAKDARFKLVQITPQNKQPFPYVRNVALEASTSKWIAILDGDDWWEPWKLERQLEAVANAPDTLICCTRAWVWQNDAKAGQNPGVGTSEIAATLPVRNVFAHSTMLISRQAMNELGGYDLSMRTSQDWELWMRMYWQHGAERFISMDDVAVYYRRHESNITSQPLRCNQFEWRVVRHTLGQCGWGLRRPIVAWRVLDYWADRTVAVNRFAHRYRPALGWAVVAAVVRPTSRWRWMQIGRVIGEWRRYQPQADEQAASK